VVVALVVVAVMVEHRLREGDEVELRPGAPVPGYRWLQPGLRGRVLIADAPDAREATEEVTVIFAGHGGSPIRLHQRWLHLLRRRPRGPGRRRG
jgi:hypothetical protein